MGKNKGGLSIDVARDIAEHSYTDEQQADAFINGFMSAIEIMTTLKENK